MSEELKLSGKTVLCPVCSKKTAIEENAGGITSWMCVSCGFTANTTFTENNSEFKGTPQSIINMKHWDATRNIFWIPTVINIPSRGLIVPEKHGKQIIWSCMLMVDIPPEEQHNYPIADSTGKFYERKLDATKTLQYTRFYDAIKSLGAIIELDGLDENVKEEKYDA